MCDCIEWTGYIDKWGYGKRSYEGAKRLAHRVAYAQHHGLKMADIDGKVIMHTCDNPACVNPDHLVIGTNKDNTHDMMRKGRMHRKLTDADVAAIRADPRRPYSLIAKDYGISSDYVGQIKKGVWRKHRHEGTE